MDTFGNDLSTSTGQVLTQAELLRRRERLGECLTCGRKCFQKKLLKMKPLTIPGEVLEGRCLKCKPQDPTREIVDAACVAVSSVSASSMTNSVTNSLASSVNSRSGGVHRSIAGSATNSTTNSRTNGIANSLTGSVASGIGGANRSVNRSMTSGTTNSIQSRSNPMARPTNSGSDVRDAGITRSHPPTTTSSRSIHSQGGHRGQRGLAGVEERRSSQGSEFSEDANQFDRSIGSDFNGSSNSNNFNNFNSSNNFNNSSSSNFNEGTNGSTNSTNGSNSSTNNSSGVVRPRLGFKSAKNMVKKTSRAFSKSLSLDHNSNNSQNEPDSPGGGRTSFDDGSGGDLQRLQRRGRNKPIIRNDFSLEQSQSNSNQQSQYKLQGQQGQSSQNGQEQFRTSHHSSDGEEDEDSFDLGSTIGSTLGSTLGSLGRSHFSTIDDTIDENPKIGDIGNIGKSYDTRPTTTIDENPRIGEPYQTRASSSSNGSARSSAFLQRESSRPSALLHKSGLDAEFLAAIEQEDALYEEEERRLQRKQRDQQREQQFDGSFRSDGPDNESVTSHHSHHSHISHHSSRSQHSSRSHPSHHANPPQHPNHPNSTGGSGGITRAEYQTLQTLNSPTCAPTSPTAFSHILQLMVLHPQSMLVQNEALHALSLIHHPPFEVLDESGTNSTSVWFEVIVNAMNVVQHDDTGQTNACKVLFITSSHERHQIAIGHAGGIHALANAMQRFSDDAIVVEGCLLALSNIAIPRENLPIILSENVLELVISAMRNNVENCGISEHGCTIISHLALHNDHREHGKHGDPRSLLRQLGACDTLIVAMVVNPMDAQVQSQALLAIRNLCLRDDNENKLALANAGALDAIIGAMQCHRDDCIVQERGAWVLSILGMVPENKVYIGENGGLDVIVRAMWVHPAVVGVQEKGCRALWTLSVDKGNKYTMVEVGAIAAVISAMQRHASEPSIQEKGCGVLSNLAANDDRLKVQIVKEEALDVVVMAMVLHGENEVLQDRAVTLLRKLCIEENVASMVVANVSPLMAVVAENYPGMREKAEYVIAQLEVS